MDGEPVRLYHARRALQGGKAAIWAHLHRRGVDGLAALAEVVPQMDDLKYTPFARLLLQALSERPAGQARR